MMKITRPTLLLDEAKVIKNLERMRKKASDTQTELIPHFKTHQSKEIGDLYRAFGIDKIAVSSVKMATYFADHDWFDITVAFPFNVLEIPIINQLLDKGVRLTLLITEVSTLARLSSELKASVNLMIEIDAGYGRSGVSSQDQASIQKLCDSIDDLAHLNLYGLYCHPGDTYHSHSREEINEIWQNAIVEMNRIKRELERPGLKVRMGDTPGCSIVNQMDGVDEIGPGNFIFYDLVMNYLDVCDESDIAIAVACPVVAKKAKERQLILHGGAVHFSKDHLFDEKGQKFFGELVILNEQGWSSIIAKAKLISVSQEHGILSVDQETYDAIHVGDVVGILPIHSCLTANLLKEYQTVDGKLYEHLEKVF